MNDKFWSRLTIAIFIAIAFKFVEAWTGWKPKNLADKLTRWVKEA